MGFVVPSRFCGPPESGNGGWVSGHLAALLRPGPDESVTVRLRTPPPLDRELEVSTGDADGRRTLEVADGEHPVAQATTGAALEPTGIPAAVSFAAATRAGDDYEGLADHPFATCFSCGTAREPGRHHAAGELLKTLAEHLLRMLARNDGLVERHAGQPGLDGRLRNAFRGGFLFEVFKPALKRAGAAGGRKRGRGG
jgi:hypothetical protein